MTTTPPTTMLTKNTTELRTLVEQHVAADQVLQGVYWDADEHRGCFIGCLNHSNDPSRAEERFGLPIMTQRIAENIFEALPADKAKAFFAALPDAVACDDKDLSRVGWQFLAAELRALPEVDADIQAVIDPVIAGMDLLAGGQEWAAADAAKAAANAAWANADQVAAASASAAALAATPTSSTSSAASAAQVAAQVAAASALAATAAADAAIAATDADTEAARAATWAVRAAAATAADVAWDTARLRQRDLLLQLIAEAPVVRGGGR